MKMVRNWLINRLILSYLGTMMLSGKNLCPYFPASGLTMTGQIPGTVGIKCEKSLHLRKDAKRAKFHQKTGTAM